MSMKIQGKCAEEKKQRSQLQFPAEPREDPQALSVFWIPDSLWAEPQPGSVQPSWPKVLESDSAPEPAPSPESVGVSDLASVLPSCHGLPAYPVATITFLPKL